MGKMTIRCPYCGSEKKAGILWGMPAWSENLENDLNAGKVIIGGCIVSGEDPSYECRKCGKRFGRPPVLKIPDENGAGFINMLPEKITGIEYSIGGFFDGSITVKMVKEGTSSAVCVVHSHLDGLFRVGEFTAAEWKRLTDKLFSRLFVHEWDQEYVDPYTLDGTQWSLAFSNEEGKEYSIYGSNAYPPLFGTLDRMFRYYARRDALPETGREERAKLAYLFRKDEFISRRIEEANHNE